LRVPGGSAEGVYNGIVSMQYTGLESLQTTWRNEGADSGSMEQEEECPDELADGGRESGAGLKIGCGRWGADMARGVYFLLRRFEREK